MSTMVKEGYDAFEDRFHQLVSSLQTLKWMVGTNIVLTMGILFTLIGFLAKS